MQMNDGSRDLRGRTGKGLATRGTIEAYQEGADFFVVSGRPFENGCSLGSLASEIVKTDLDVGDDLTRVFAEWRDIF